MEPDAQKPSNRRRWDGRQRAETCSIALKRAGETEQRKRRGPVLLHSVGGRRQASIRWEITSQILRCAGALGGSRSGAGACAQLRCCDCQSQVNCRQGREVLSTHQKLAGNNRCRLTWGNSMAKSTNVRVAHAQLAHRVSTARLQKAHTSRRMRGI